MNTCLRCEGFAPPDLSCCPNCAAPIEASAAAVPGTVAGVMRRVGQAAAVAATAVTLMACYGAPGGEYTDYVPTTSIQTACDNVEDLLLDEALTDDNYTQGASNAVEPSCATATLAKERIYRFAAPADGELHFEWVSDSAVTVSLRPVCAGSVESLCEPPSTQGAIDVGLTNGEEVFLTVDATANTSFDFTASFAPAP